MAKDGGKKTFGEKLKSSPAAKSLKEHGLLHTAKTLGRYAKEDLQDHYDRGMDYLFPGDTSHKPSRVDHFNDGASEHLTVREKDLDQAGGMVDHFLSHGESPQPYREGNVSSIVNGFANRAKKLPPEGY